MPQRGAPDPAAFIAENLPLQPVPAVPEIVLHGAHPGSGLSRLVGYEGAPPYWAYRWAGGTVLARHLLDRPDTVRGRTVLDLGAGSGLVGIAAMKAGAAAVVASEIDAFARLALESNARANGVVISAILGDLLDGAPLPGVDLVAVGDLFYAPDLAARVTAFLHICVMAGAIVLVGDPGRAYLPQDRLRPVAHYAVPDYGAGGAVAPSTVFAFM